MMIGNTHNFFFWPHKELILISQIGTVAFEMNILRVHLFHTCMLYQNYIYTFIYYQNCRHRLCNCRSAVNLLAYLIDFRYVLKVSPYNCILNEPTIVY